VKAVSGNYSHIYWLYAFDTFDTNNDGTIDFDEFLLSVAATSQGNLDERLSVAFDL
jgi:Ca2+-binding EF-hand superfamily protein